MNIKPIYIVIGLLFAMQSCQNKSEVANSTQGKVERDELSVVSKIPGRIDQIMVQEGDFVKKGDTLAVLDIPEVEAKKAQAQGAVRSATAQYDMSVHGATSNQLTQLNAKKAGLTEQYEFAKKSLARIESLAQDSLIPQQQYDEVYAKYQGAKAQLTAVEAEIADVQNGVRMEQQVMALGQKDRAVGALQEAQVAEGERYILAPQDMLIETITLKIGELALPGYTLFKGTLENTTYFRFTVPESELGVYERGKELAVHIPYKNRDVQGVIKNVKQIGAYANIATAYPDYEMQDALYEIIVNPMDPGAVKDIYTKSTVIIKR